MPTKVIISCCPADEMFLKHLLANLKAYGPAVLAACWSPLSVQPGQQRDLAFAQALETAEVAVLLVSPSYLADEQVRAELSKIMALVERGTLRLYPVPVRAVDWERQPFGKIKPTWSPKQPLASLRRSDQDACYVTLGRLINDVVTGAAPGVVGAPGPAPKRLAFQFMAILTTIVTTGGVISAVSGLYQLLSLPLALVATAVVAIALALRYIGPWRDSLRRHPAWVPCLVGFLTPVWGVFCYKLIYGPAPQPKVTVTITVLDDRGHLVYNADVVPELGTITKESGRYLLTLERPQQPFKVHASRSMEEKGETRVAPGQVTAEIRLTATPSVYTLYLSPIDENEKPVRDAEITTPVGQLKRTGSTWEIVIAAALKPNDPFEIQATADGGLAGAATVTLLEEENQVVPILMKRDTSAMLEGKVVDRANQPVQGATVNVEGYEAEAQTTDENGRFSLNTHKAKDQWARIVVKPVGRESFNEFVRITDQVVTLAEKK